MWNRQAFTNEWKRHNLTIWKITAWICLTSMTLSKATSIIAIFVQSLHISSISHHFSLDTFWLSFIDEKSIADYICSSFFFWSYSEFNCIVFLYLILCIWIGTKKKLESIWTAFCYFSSFLTDPRSSSK